MRPGLMRSGLWVLQLCALSQQSRMASFVSLQILKPSLSLSCVASGVPSQSRSRSGRAGSQIYSPGAAVRGKALRGGGRTDGRDGMVADVESNWSSQRLVAAPEKLESAGFAPRMSGALGAARRREAEMKRRSARQFWRPPERTKEWVESHWYRRRHGEETLPLAPASRFWRDYAAAIAEGRESAFRSAAVIDAADTLTDMVAALAVTRLGFAAKEGESVVFTRGGAAAGGETVRVERHFFDAAEGNEDGSPKEVTDEFVRGTAYKARTIVMNPTSRQLRVRVVSQLPEGAFPLSAGLAAEDISLVLPPYGVQTMPWQEFYFPCDGADVGRAAAAVAVERGGIVQRRRGAFEARHDELALRLAECDERRSPGVPEDEDAFERRPFEDRMAFRRRGLREEGAGRPRVARGLLPGAVARRVQVEGRLRRAAREGGAVQARKH